MNDQSAYIHSLLGEPSQIIKDLEYYATKENVPIMERDSLEIMLQYLTMLNPTNILEIGTAIGYSGACMLQAAERAHLVTIERDSLRAEIADETFRKMNVTNRVTLLKGDALDMVQHAAESGPFDVLFIDAAKGQYERFFDLYSLHVKSGGVVFTDNVLFKGLVAKDSDHSNRNTRALVRKIRNFNKKMMQSSEWQSVIVPAGDGLMISRKKNGVKMNGKT